MFRVQACGGAQDAVRNMQAIDAIYRKAGLQPRRGVPVAPPAAASSGKRAAPRARRASSPKR